MLLVGIGAIVIVLVVVLVYSFFPGKKSEQPQPSPSIAPNVIIPPQVDPETLPADVKKIREEIIAKQIANNHGDILLHQADSFKIEYIPSPDVFFVTISKDPAIAAKKQAQDWFLDFGLKQSDLCDLPVRFVLRNFEVRKTNANFTSLPDGCSGTPLKKP